MQKSQDHSDVFFLLLRNTRLVVVTASRPLRTFKSSAYAFRLLFAALTTLLASASPSRRSSRLDLPEPTARLFPSARPVLAAADAWTFFSLQERGACSFSSSCLAGDVPTITARAVLAAHAVAVLAAHAVAATRVRECRCCRPGGRGGATTRPGTELTSLARAIRAGAANAHGIVEVCGAGDSAEVRFTQDLASARGYRAAPGVRPAILRRNARHKRTCCFALALLATPSTTAGTRHAKCFAKESTTKRSAQTNTFPAKHDQ